MAQCAFASVQGGNSFLRSLHQGTETCTIAVTRTRYTRRKRTRSRINSHEKLEPVEDGVTLPKPSSTESLQRESQWLARQIRDWLDGEWRQGGAQEIHAKIGQRVSQIYVRQRMEGEDDLLSVLLAMGSELEGMDFTQAFVGPWNVANKTSELLLEYGAGGGRGTVVEKNSEGGEGDGIAWSKEREMEGEGRNRERAEGGRVAVAVAVDLEDGFERMKFLRDLLDGVISKEGVNGAIAAAVGFRYDEEKGRWDGSKVSDEHFRQFADTPTDVLGDEKSREFTETLLYLEEMLDRNDDDGKIAEGLEILIETVHGVELYKIQREDEKDHAFRKRVVVAKWLHLYAGF